MSPRAPRSETEKRLLEKAAKYLPGATLHFYMPGDSAFLIKEGRGSKVYDFSGNEYIDYLLGSGPLVLGHAHPAIVSAVRDYLDRGTTYFVTNAPILELAEEIVQAVPCADKVRFTTSGTDAVFQCLRLARAYRKRDKILKFEGGYHGSSDYVSMSVNSPDLREYPLPVPESAGIPRAVQEQVLVAPFNDIETTSAIIEKHRDELGGVVVEPLQRWLPPKPGFLQGLREVTSRYEIPLVFDEVVTGFRLAWGGAQEYYDVVPDLAAYGKIMGGGFPLAAICGREEIMRLYDFAIEGTPDFVPQVGTLSGNPIAAVAGLATLRELKKPGAFEKLHATGNRLKGALASLLRQAGVAAQVVGEPPVFEVLFSPEPVSDYRTSLKADRQMLRRFIWELWQHGVFRGYQKFYVSLAHTSEDVHRTMLGFSAAIEGLT